MKYFIITVDTEGDNLWAYKGGEIGTKNAEYLPRFQKLCEAYNFKPVYLTNYEMIQSDLYCQFAKDVIARNTAEIGIHLHAWNNPPLYDLPRNFDQNSYLIEYPLDIRRQKFSLLYNLIKDKIGIAPVTHRAGRWVMDVDYFNMLNEFNIKVDCSVTPFVSWEKTPGQMSFCGSDYSKANPHAHKIGEVLEVPMSVRKLHYLLDGRLKHKIKTVFLGNSLWLRPAMSSLKEMKHLIDVIDKDENADYLEFMIHSSEVMPNGSPYFITHEDIEKEYSTIQSIFDYVKSKGYYGVTLSEYYQLKNH